MFPYLHFAFQSRAMGIPEATFQLRNHVILTWIFYKMALENLEISFYEMSGTLSAVPVKIFRIREGVHE